MNLISSPFSGKQKEKVLNVILNIEKGLGGWVRGQLTLSLFIGILSYIALKIIGIPYALPLALFAGLLEIVPIVGPIVSAIPAILVGLSIAPMNGFIVAIAYTLIQQLENHIIVPIVMSRAVGLQPPLVIVTLLIGATLYGIGGAFLAVPFAVLLKIIIKELVLEDGNLEQELTEE